MPEWPPNSDFPTILANAIEAGFRSALAGRALTQREEQLVQALRAAGGEPISRKQLHDALFPNGSWNSVDVYVGYVRKKLGPDAIKTVRGVGYAWGERARGATDS
jgi:DNA-binding response OmpR family regulator